MADAMYGPGAAAVAVLALSLAAKLFMSFAVRSQEPETGYVPLSDAAKKSESAGKAQLNVAEYEALFIAIFLFLHVKKADGICVTIIIYTVPIAQAVYFWGRALTGQMMPWAPLGALPRYVCMGISIYVLYTIVSTDGELSLSNPGLAAVAVLALSLAAKLCMSFGFRALDKEPGDAGKAQLNCKEYEALFIAIFLFLDIVQAESILVTIVGYTVPIAQAVYFWGRVATGKAMPWSPMGALPRYACMGMSIYILFPFVVEGKASLSNDNLRLSNPGFSALCVLALSLAAKLCMSFGFRIADKDPGDAGKAQLNVAEYEDLFIAILLFLLVLKADGMLVGIVGYTVPIAQAVYFWGRVITGKMMPWAPLGALPRYIAMGMSVYIIYTSVAP